MKKDSAAAASNAADYANDYTGAKSSEGKTDWAGDPDCPWGRKVAMRGISGMDAESKGNEDVESFMEECKRSGKDPIDVVSFIASHQCVDPSRGQPYDKDARRLFDLIVGVINRVYGRDVFSEEACEDDDGQNDVLIRRRRIRMPRLARCEAESDPRHSWGWMGIFLKDLMDM